MSWPRSGRNNVPRCRSASGGHSRASRRGHRSGRRPATSAIIRRALSTPGDTATLKSILVAILIAVVNPTGAARQPDPGPLELVVCGWDEVFILSFGTGIGTAPRKTWTWRAKGRADVPDDFETLFRTTDECKPFDGGSRILITSSGGGVALVDRATDRVVFYGRAANAHSADLLPRGRVAVAASHDQAGKGDRLILFDLARSNEALWSGELPWGHGVVWDERRNVLWALADEDIRVYERRDWESSAPVLHRVALIPLPEGGGHDLAAVPGTSLMSVSTAKRCWLFDRDARTFRPHPELADKAKVKSISYHPVRATLAYVQAENSWWAERIHFLNPASTLQVAGEHFYKVRWVSSNRLQAEERYSFETVVMLETTSEDSANVSMGDLDRDGDLDLVLAKGRHTPILDRVLLNDGKGAFVVSDLGPTPDRTYTAALADVDGDGDLDVLTSNDRPDKKLVHLNDGKGRFTVGGTWGVPEWSTRNAAVADLNGDGKADVIAANRPGPSFACLNDGQGRFSSSCIPIPAASATSIVPADFDKDGHIDLAVPSRDVGQSHIYFNDGKAGFARTIPFGPADAAARAAAAADFDGDGSIDLVVGDEKAASLVVYLNDGKGRLTPAFQTADKSKTPYAIAAGDLNDDRKPDIVFGYTEGPHAVFFNDGTGRHFARMPFGERAGAAYGFALGDVNGDRIVDIALARSGAPNVLYLGRKGTR